MRDTVVDGFLGSKLVVYLPKLLAIQAIQSALQACYAKL